jgi:hypothetical protein
MPVVPRVEAGRRPRYGSGGMFMIDKHGIRDRATASNNSHAR